MAPCLICPDRVCEKKRSAVSSKYKALSIIVIAGVFIYFLGALYLQLQSVFVINSTNRSSHQKLYLVNFSHSWKISVEDQPAPGPWKFAGLWMGNDVLHNSSRNIQSDDVKTFTGFEVRYLSKHITSARLSSYRLLNTFSTAPKVGEVLQFVIEARDGKGTRQKFGGDFWTGILSDPMRKAYSAGRMFDFGNGTYLMTFVLSWSGETHIQIRLIYPSRVTNWLRTRYRTDNHYPTWQGSFRRGKQTKISQCYLSYGQIPSNVCEYRNERALTHTRFYCRKPAGFACGNLVGHRNVLPYGKVTARIMQADQIDIFKGVESFKPIEGVPLTINVYASDDQSYRSTRLQLPPCGTDLPVSISDGYWMNSAWTSLVCKPTLEYSRSVIQNCLKNTHVHLTGDSTTRQWFFSLTDALNINIPGGNDKTKMKYRYYSNTELNFNLTFTFHPLTYQRSFVVNISQMRFETDVLFNLPSHTCNHVVVISPWTHFMTWPWEAYVEWLTNIKSAIIEARKRCPEIKIVIKSPHALENKQTSRSMMGVDVLFWDMKKQMRDIFEGNRVLFVDTWDMNQAYPEPNDMHMPRQVIDQEIAVFLSYICA